MATVDTITVTKNFKFICLFTLLVGLLQSHFPLSLFFLFQCRNRAMLTSTLLLYHLSFIHERESTFRGYVPELRCGSDFIQFQI
ncbi:expressed protein [Echinococcus multilocularis]|uniref:Expressed protein n=1 Tax=Echinococcus multilocularis TaxID=6211 RepID=A0A068Y799_ECHMU|nr:expressed protein [Echinococcus multilocularis]